MSIAARCLNRELALVFVVVLLVLLVMALGGRFLGYLQEAAAGKFNTGSLVWLLAYRLPEFAQLLLPISLFLAVVLTLGRGYAEQEMTVLLTAGLTVRRLVGWLLPQLLLVALLVAWCSLELNPRWQRASNALLAAERADRDFANLRAGVFHVYARGNRVSYAEGFDEAQGELLQVFLGERQSLKGSVTVRAERGRQYLDPATASRFLLLSEGSRVEGTPGAGRYRVIEFERMGQRLALAPRPDPELRATQQDTVDLLRLQTSAAQAELGYRWSLPVLTLIAALLAIALSPIRPRQGRFARLPTALLFFLAYYLLLVLQKDVVASDRWPTAFAFWPVHALFAAVAVYGLRRMGRPRRV